MAEQLDAAAARLMGWTLSEDEASWVSEGCWCRFVRGRGGPFWSPATNLNDAAELFRAAPEVVRHNVFIDLDHDMLDPTALTRAVVEAWEEHNRRVESGESCAECGQILVGPKCLNCGQAHNAKGGE